MKLDHLQNFKSVVHVVRILQTSPFFTQITHFLDNRWSDRLEILHSTLDYHYLTLVQISSRYLFPILRYIILLLVLFLLYFWGAPKMREGLKSDKSIAALFKTRLTLCRGTKFAKCCTGYAGYVWFRAPNPDS